MYTFSPLRKLWRTLKANPPPIEFVPDPDLRLVDLALLDVVGGPPLSHLDDLRVVNGRRGVSQGVLDQLGELLDVQVDAPQGLRGVMVLPDDASVMPTM